MRSKTSFDAEIEFASQVGFLTRHHWTEFFAKGGPRWQRYLWRRLKDEGMFLPHTGALDLYLPNPKHPAVVALVPFVARPPVLSQLGHDKLVAQSYLLLKRALPNCRIKTEAYLKKEAPISNKSLRVQDQQKHPDLVLDFEGQKTAVEIELLQKTRSRYRAILRSYRRAGFSRVIYLIRSEGTMSAVECAAMDVSFPRKEIALGFGSVGEWRVDPMATEIHFEHSTCALSKLLVP